MKALNAGTQVSRAGGLILVLLSAAAGSVMMTSPASAQTLTTLVNFDGGNGQNPEYGSLLSDANGNLYGTTSQDTNYGYGLVFEVTNTAGTYSGTAIPLVTFDGSQGIQPYGGLIADTSGNLFGTTAQGGTGGTGTVFEIANYSGNTYASTPTTLVNFDSLGAAGARPDAGLLADSSGNLFGTTIQGGAGGSGTVFEIANIGSGTYAASQSPLASFDGITNGSEPVAGLIADSNGNLFGTTMVGGANHYGTVFELVNTTTGYTLNTLVNFDGTHGRYPYAGLIADSNGNLFGTTKYGGAHGLGTVFEIPYSAGVYATTPTVLVSFDGPAYGSYPVGGLIQDANGSLFGTTSSGGANGFGTIFEISKTSGVYATTPTKLIDFTGVNGGYPLAGLIADANGNLFGTTSVGGTSYDPVNYNYGDGTVFELSASGFAPPRKFAGTPGAPNCNGVSISKAMATYGGAAHAAAALGYASAADLRSAIAQYCSN